MNKIIASTLLTLLFFEAMAQEGNVLLAENFDNNALQWKLADRSDHFRTIGNGKMMLETRSKLFYWSAQSIDTDKKKDFRIETELSFTKYKGGQAGIMWGGSSDEDKVYFFFVCPDGSWNYGVWSPSFFSYTGSQKSDLVKKGLATNKLKLERVDNKLKLFVNDVEVHSARFPSTKGTNMGLVCGGGNIAVEADYFRVTELESD